MALYFCFSFPLLVLFISFLCLSLILLNFSFLYFFFSLLFKYVNRKLSNQTSLGQYNYIFRTSALDLTNSSKTTERIHSGKAKLLTTATLCCTFRMFQEVEEADETGEQLEAGETERAAEQAKMIGKLSNF